MFVKKFFEKIRLLIQLTLLCIQTIIGGIIFILLVIPTLIYEYIMKPKVFKCKIHNCDLIPQGYPDELGFQKYKCPRCN